LQFGVALAPVVSSHGRTVAVSDLCPSGAETAFGEVCRIWERDPFWSTTISAALDARTPLRIRDGKLWL
jgi:hypothetical protein